MTKPAAKKGDRVVAVDTHILMIPSPGGPVPTPTPMPFAGILQDGLIDDVLIEDQPAAVMGSKAKNTPPHVPTGGPFQKTPTDEATIQIGCSTTVLIADKQASRNGDTALTCNDPVDAPNGTVVAAGTVLVGG